MILNCLLLNYFTFLFCYNILSKIHKTNNNIKCKTQVTQLNYNDIFILIFRIEFINTFKLIIFIIFKSYYSFIKLSIHVYYFTFNLNCYFL